MRLRYAFRQFKVGVGWVARRDPKNGAAHCNFGNDAGVDSGEELLAAQRDVRFDFSRTMRGNVTRKKGNGGEQ